MQVAVRRDAIQIDSDSDDDEPCGSFSTNSENGNELLQFALLEHDLDLLVPAVVAEETEPHVPAGIVTDPEVLYQLYLDKVLEVFPDICRDHARLLYDTQLQALGPQRSPRIIEYMSQGVIMQILDSEKYPKQRDTKKKLKRKRSTESNRESESENFERADRPRLRLEETQEARILLLWEFSRVPLKFIDQQLKEQGHLYHTYLAIEKAERTFDDNNPSYTKLRASRKHRSPVEDMGHGQSRLLTELLAAKKKRVEELAKSLKEQQEAEADAARDRQCVERGEIVECQCCFTDTPLPKSTTCPGGHPFCFECMQSNTKAQVELSRYQVLCMDGSGCKEAFSREEKHRFLDIKMLELLERLQQQADLRAADVEGLESCPFCDYAAIYPPVEEDKEFRCLMPTCEIVSCRLCRQVSHIPKTCAEYKKDQGVEERHVLEEAMTKALLKTCPKCGVSIVKEGGCNKMICSQCRTAVCDYCGQDITKSGYSHFDNSAPMSDGTTRRGKGCPPHDDTDNRNKRRIEAAEKDTIAQIRTENPGISEEDLKIKFSEAVQRSATVDRPIHHGHRPNLLNAAGIVLQGFPGHADRLAGYPFGQNRPAPALTEQLLQQHNQNLQNQQNFRAQHAAHTRNHGFAPPNPTAAPYGYNPFTQENLPMMPPFVPQLPRGPNDPMGLRIHPFAPGQNPPMYDPQPPPPMPTTIPLARQPATDKQKRSGRRGQNIDALYQETNGLAQQHPPITTRPNGHSTPTIRRFDPERGIYLGINNQTNPINETLTMERRPPLPPRGTKGMGVTMPETHDMAPANLYPPPHPFDADWNLFPPGYPPPIDPALFNNDQFPNADRDLPPLFSRRRLIDLIDLEANDDQRPNSRGKGVVRPAYINDPFELHGWQGTKLNGPDPVPRRVAYNGAPRTGPKTSAFGVLPEVETKAKPRAKAFQRRDEFGILPELPHELGARSAGFAPANPWPFGMEG